MTLTIAYNVNLPSWDPTVGPSAVNPTIQGIYQSVFDQYIGQKPDLSFTPGLLTEWGWNDDETKIMMTVREGATWHDGSPFDRRGRGLVAGARRQREDRQSDPVRLEKIGNFKIDGNKITGRRELQFEPTLFKWMALPHRLRAARRPITRRSAPRASRRSRSAPAPTWSTSSSSNAFVRLKANPNYWGGKPAFDTVIIKFVPDATSRVAEIESGNSAGDARDPLRGVSTG